MGFFYKGLKNEFETAVVNEPAVFEPLKFYCIYRGLKFKFLPSGHFNVESTSDLNVETTLKYGWIWKLDGRWNDDVESTMINWCWINVDYLTLIQRRGFNVESTLIVWRWINFILSPSNLQSQP